MRRLIAVAAVSAAVLAVPSSTAAADFPEVPADVTTACTAVLTNPGTGVGGATTGRMAPRAAAITAALIEDACFGG
jgi:hypothetical protein